jgi:hypothetical protein
MTLKAAIIITLISIALLIIYGSDAAIGGGTGQGFLPFDHKIRGVALGIPSVVLPIIAYVISKKESSKLLGILITISGLLTVIGSAAFLGMQDQSALDESKNRASEFAPIITLGALIVGLGIMKIKKSSKPVSK